MALYNYQSRSRVFFADAGSIKIPPNGDPPAGRHGGGAENELRVSLSMGAQNVKISIRKLLGGTAVAQKMSLE